MEHLWYFARRNGFVKIVPYLLGAPGLHLNVEKENANERHKSSKTPEARRSFYKPKGASGSRMMLPGLQV